MALKFIKLFEQFNDEYDDEYDDTLDGIEEHDFTDYEKAQEGGFWGSKASGILPIAKDTGKILIGLRSQDVNEPLTWGNFGGAIGLADDGSEEDELSPSDNARKEMMEEIAYTGSMKVVDSYVFEKDDFIYYNFLGIISNQHDISKDNTQLNWEVDELKWVELDELVNHPDLHFGIQGLLDNSYDQIKAIVEKIKN